MKLLPIQGTRIKLLLLSLMHLATDGLCAYLVLARLYPENSALSFAIFIGYNFLAFVMEAPLGILIDKQSSQRLFLGASTVSILLGYVFYDLPVLAVLFLGLGNALFHIAGGKYITDKSGNDVAYLGIFVSTGAIGLTLAGTYPELDVLAYILFSLLIICTLNMLFTKDPENRKDTATYQATKRGATVALLSVVAVVFARSFVGKVATPDFHLTRLLVFAIPLATAFGKAIGGILSRALGILPTTIASMSIAAVCLVLGASNPALYILGVFAFNFSMPITLYYANIILKGNEGFAFGSLAAILMPGYLIAMLCSYSIWIKILTAVLCLFSVLVIAIISKRIKYAD